MESYNNRSKNLCVLKVVSLSTRSWSSSSERQTQEQERIGHRDDKVILTLYVLDPVLFRAKYSAFHEIVLMSLFLFFFSSPKEVEEGEPKLGTI